MSALPEGARLYKVTVVQEREAYVLATNQQAAEDAALDALNVSEAHTTETVECDRDDVPEWDLQDFVEVAGAGEGDDLFEWVSERFHAPTVEDVLDLKDLEDPVITDEDY